MIHVKQKENLRRFNSTVISIAEVQSKRPYLDIQVVLCDSLINSNNEGVTPAFIYDVVDRKSSHIGLPLLADVRKINRGDYRRGLGHMYDEQTGQFLTEQIGSFYDFDVSTEGDVVSLIGKARVYKRNDKVTLAIKNLYAEGNLSFSFELEAGETRVENGVLWVDKSELNNLIGMAVVSVPAYQSARALALVAEDKRDAYQKAVQNAAILASDEMLAEASFETITSWVWNAVYDRMRKSGTYFDFHFLYIGVDSAAIYEMESGKMFRIDYVIRESDVFITDIYEVELVRAADVQNESESEVEEMPKEVTTETTVDEAVEEVVAEEVAEVETEAAETEQEETKVEAETEAPEAEDVQAEDNTEESSEPAESLEQKLAEQAKRIAELEAIEQKWNELEQAKAQVAEAKKQEELVAQAKAAGLDVEDDTVKAALEGKDYAQLVSLIFQAALARSPEATPESKVPHNPMVADMRLSGEWLFSKE